MCISFDDNHDGDVDGGDDGDGDDNGDNLNGVGSYVHFLWESNEAS